MKRILTALILIPLVLLLVFKAPLSALALVTLIVALLATHEYLHIVSHYDVVPFRRATILLLVCYYAAAASLTPAPVTLALASLPMFIGAFIYLTASMTRPNLRESLPSAAMSFFALPYIGFSLASLMWIRLYLDGTFWLVVLFATVWAGDSVAMYVGKAFGRHKLAPRISPNKTWEGSIGSIVGSLVFAAGVLAARPWILSHSTMLGFKGAGYEPNVVHFFALVVVLNIAGQLGDLVESVMKRGADVKDSGSLLPGHGGILDRIDALLFAAPVLWYYLAITRS
jgi:phosphatidate cytidylyltransferase